ncbi:hypothetical protein D3C86_923950 [compost metagenome]
MHGMIVCGTPIIESLLSLISRNFFLHHWFYKHVLFFFIRHIVKWLLRNIGYTILP